MSLSVLNSRSSRFNQLLVPAYRVMYKKGDMASYSALHKQAFKKNVVRDLVQGDCHIVGEHKRTKTIYVNY